MKTEPIDYFKEIERKKPSDIIIEQIRTLIMQGILKPGDRLPSERNLSEKLRIGRNYVREAIKKLEFYGILNVIPQSGTYIASLGVKALEGLIANILHLEKGDFDSFMETRAVLETHATMYAAQRATEEDIEELQKTHKEFHGQVLAGNSGLDEDLLFHLKIAEISRNSVLSSLISLITPDILRMSNDRDLCRENRSLQAFREHEVIMDAIEKRDPKRALEAMQVHMDKTIDLIHGSMPLNTQPS
jgi:GntR family transcriptional repressor for pyruvate dehydrogenase complex